MRLPETGEAVPHAHLMTTHVANGGTIDGAAWVEATREQLASVPATLDALPELRVTYLRSRSVTGSIRAGGIFLPGLVAAADRLLNATAEDLQLAAQEYRPITEAHLSGGSESSCDYPEGCKDYLATLAALTDEPFQAAFRRLRTATPALVALATDAAELSNRSQARMRLIINQVMPEPEVAKYRRMPLEEGSAQLLQQVRERTGMHIPARVMQLDMWRQLLYNPLPYISKRLGITAHARVDSAVSAFRPLVGHMLVRRGLGVSPDDAHRQLLRHAPSEAGLGAHGVLHEDWFQGLLNTPTGVTFSFARLVQSAREVTLNAVIKADGSVDLGRKAGEHGGCPAQNLYAYKTPHPLGHAAAGIAAVAALKQRAHETFGARPNFTEPSIAELIGGIAAELGARPGGVFYPGSAPYEEIVRFKEAAT